MLRLPKICKCAPSQRQILFKGHLNAKVTTFSLKWSSFIIKQKGIGQKFQKLARKP